jgi:hypothetical protein
MGGVSVLVETAPKAKIPNLIRSGLARSNELQAQRLDRLRVRPSVKSNLELPRENVRVARGVEWSIGVRLRIEDKQWIGDAGWIETFFH